MTNIPENENTTVNAIYNTYSQSSFRSHLGASEIGESCERKLWYSFRWAKEKNFPQRILRLFDTGKREEIRLIDELKKAGFKVYEVDDQGNQFGFKKGHFAGSIDGVIVGILEAPKTPHLLEIKTMSEKYFELLKKDGCEKAQPKHFAQIQIYMGALNLDRALYLVVNKNTDEIYQERLAFNKEFYSSLLDKAGRIINAKTPLPKISENPGWYECKFCDYYSICHHHDAVAKNCRTCEKCEIALESFECMEWDRQLSFDKQKEGCDKYQVKECLDIMPF